MQHRISLAPQETVKDLEYSSEGVSYNVMGDESGHTKFPFSYRTKRLTK